MDRVGVAFPAGQAHEHNVHRDKYSRPRRHSTRDAGSITVSIATIRNLVSNARGSHVQYNQCRRGNTVNTMPQYEYRQSQPPPNRKILYHPECTRESRLAFFMPDHTLARQATCSISSFWLSSTLFLEASQPSIILLAPPAKEINAISLASLRASDHGTYFIVTHVLPGWKM
jgi:hypothetical protein